jgi:predicted dehydrogenase
MNDRVRMALIGTGQIGVQSHFPAALACDAVELVAVVDAATERAARLVDSYGLSIPVFGKLDQALNGVEGAIIATPNATHAALATECLRHGVSVLIEKPMTVSSAQGDDLVGVAAATGKAVMVGYVTRYRPNVQLLKSLLGTNHFGRVRRFAYQAGTIGGWAPHSGYVGDRARGGGVLAVTGSHFLDRMLWLWGYPSECEYWDDGTDGPEANAVARFVFGDGMPGSLRCSKTAALPAGLVLDTESGRLVLPENDEGDLCLYPAQAPGTQYLIKRDDPNAKPGDPFVAQIREFAAVCRGAAATIGCDARQGLESVKIMAELYDKRRPLEIGTYAGAPS